jgi:hypothetical protein
LSGEEHDPGDLSDLRDLQYHLTKCVKLSERDEILNPIENDLWKKFWGQVVELTKKDLIEFPRPKSPIKPTAVGMWQIATAEWDEETRRIKIIKHMLEADASTASFVSSLNKSFEEWRGWVTKWGEAHRWEFNMPKRDPVLKSQQNSQCPSSVEFLRQDITLPLVNLRPAKHPPELKGLMYSKLYNWQYPSQVTSLRDMPERFKQTETGEPQASIKYLHIPYNNMQVCAFSLLLVLRTIACTY